MVWVMHSTVRGTLLIWHDLFVGKKQKKVKSTAPVCLFWKLWKETNRRAFEDSEQTQQAIKLSFMNTFLEWVRLYIDEVPMTMIGFVG